MEWLNYHHFFYFWTVAREGSIARAARLLRLSEPTVSAQIQALEKSIGEPLFRREARGVVLTDAGRLAQRYANHIFTLGQEFQAAIEGVGREKAARFTVGLSSLVPRLLAFRLLEPALSMPTRYIVSCQSAAPEELLVKLVTHQVDAVICDAPLDPRNTDGTFQRMLGESGVTVFGSEALVKRLRRGFPKSLDGAPILLPAESTAMRRSIERWFLMTGVRPQLQGEFTDSTLLKTFGAAGVGVFFAATAIEREIKKEYRVRVVGRIPSILERIYVVSASRKAEHPAVAAITEAARHGLFDYAVGARPPA